MTNKTMMFELSKDPEFFKCEANRIFMILGTKIDLNNYIEITIKEIGEELEINELDTIKGIEILEKKNLLTKTKYGFKLNPNVIFRREIEESEQIKDFEKDNNYYNEIYTKLIEELNKRTKNIEEISKQFNLPIELIEKIIDDNFNEE